MGNRATMFPNDYDEDRSYKTGGEQRFPQEVSNNQLIFYYIRDTKILFLVCRYSKTYRRTL